MGTTRQRPARPKPPAKPKATVETVSDRRDNYFDVKHTVQTKSGADLHLVEGGEWLTTQEIHDATTPESE